MAEVLCTLLFIILLGTFIVWGLFNEKKLIAFERKLLKVVKYIIKERRSRNA